MPPIVELIHPKTPIDKLLIKEFMGSALLDIVDIVELMIVFLCARHIDNSGNLEISVIEIPEELYEYHDEIAEAIQHVHRSVKRLLLKKSMKKKNNCNSLNKI